MYFKIAKILFDLFLFRNFMIYRIAENTASDTVLVSTQMHLKAKWKVKIYLNLIKQFLIFKRKPKAIVIFKLTQNLRFNFRYHYCCLNEYILFYHSSSFFFFFFDLIYSRSYIILSEDHFLYWMIMYRSRQMFVNPERSTFKKWGPSFASLATTYDVICKNLFL